jgi:hypothetical protein
LDRAEAFDLFGEAAVRFGYVTELFLLAVDRQQGWFDLLLQLQKFGSDCAARVRHGGSPEV